MFAVPLKAGFIFYLVVMFSGLIAAYVYEFWRSRQQEWSVSEARLCRCPSCNYLFIALRNVNTAHCPRCRGFCPVRQK